MTKLRLLTQPFVWGLLAFILFLTDLTTWVYPGSAATLMAQLTGAWQAPTAVVTAHPLVALLFGALGKRDKEIIHAEHADFNAKIFQIFFQPQGCCSLAGAGRTRQRHHVRALGRRKDVAHGSTELIAKYLFAAQNELHLIAHGQIDVFNVDYAHIKSPFVQHVFSHINYNPCPL